MPVMLKISVFRNKVPYSLLKVSRRFGGTYHLHIRGRRMRQTICSSEAVDFQRTTRRYITEDSFSTTAGRKSGPTKTSNVI
jgi:hypothetical protein